MGREVWREWERSQQGNKWGEWGRHNGMEDGGKLG